MSLFGLLLPLALAAGRLPRDASVDARELWSRNVGLGYSNVVLADGRLYTAGFDEAAGVDRVVCLDALNGAELWRRERPAEIRANFHGGGTLTTPTLDGEHLYVTDRVGRTRCLLAETGAVVWERDYTDELGLKVTFHGFSASPLIAGDALLLGLGGTLVRVDKADGALRWRTADHGDGSHANPVPFRLGERPTFAYFSGAGLALVDAESGEELSMHPWKAVGGGVNAATPLVDGSRIFITSAYDMGCAMIDYASGAPQVEWQNKRMRNKVSGCVLHEGHVYGFDESILKCIDLAGEERWRVRGLGMGALALAEGQLYVLTSGGELIVAEASPDGFHESSRAAVLEGGVYWTSPVVADGLVYCRNSLGDLICLDLRDAAAPETRQTGGATLVPLADAGGTNPLVGALPEARQLLARHLAAIGGEDALRGHRSLHLAGTIEILGAGITRTPMTIDRLAPDRWLLVYDLGKYGRVRRGFDGTVGWQLDPFYGDKLESGDALRELERTSGLHMDADFESLYRTMSTVARGTFDGRECWTVTAVLDDGRARTLYFEVDSGLLAGRESDSESLVRFAEYERFDDLSLPTLTTVLVPETGAEEVYRVDSVAYDTVDPSLFELPTEVRVLMRSPEEVEAASEELRRRHADLLGTYVGTVSGTPDAQIAILVADGRLVARPREQEPLPLVATDSPERWTLGANEVIFVVFQRDDAGSVVGMHLSVFGEESELVRRAD